MRMNVGNLLVLIAPLAVIAVALIAAVVLARRPISTEPPDPSWTVWFALGAGVFGLILVVVGQPAGALLLLLGGIWAVVGMYRYLRLRAYLEYLRAQRPAR